MKQSAAVIGAGPVGCLTALGLQQRGYDVKVFERRSADRFAPTLKQLLGPEVGRNDEAADVANGRAGSEEKNGKQRKSLLATSRSINLAISVRGLTALQFVDPHLAETVLRNAVPMRARMIHQKPRRRPEEIKQYASTSAPLQPLEDVQLDSQAYSSKGDCINSVSRLLLSRLLLDEVVQAGIEVKWEHGIESIDFHYDRSRKDVGLTFTAKGDSTHSFEFDVVFGCDGHHSSVRRAIDKISNIHVSESNVDNHYTELHIPPKSGANERERYALDPHHLHIWPRHEYMLIALPNRDGSFTSTFFGPQRIFDEHMRDAATIITFFKDQFPDALDVIGEEAIVEQICDHRPSVLGSVRCNRYHLDGRAIILGDAAHAMVPFYGQGLNCGLEDVRVLLQCLDAAASSSDKDTYEVRRAAFSAYTRARTLDLVAIQELAMSNYREMSSDVVKRTFLLRKRLDNLLEHYLPPGWWSSLYSNVTFSNMNYHRARQVEARQTLILQWLMSSAAVGAAAGIAVGMGRLSSWLRSSPT